MQSGETAMTAIKLKGNTINTVGKLPEVGSAAPNFQLVKGDLSEVSLQSYQGKKKILNIFPSLDTGVCANSVKKFNEKASLVKNTVILNISCDLPFAQGRFCQAEGINVVEALSAFRSSFAKDYGVLIVDGPIKGLCSRAIVVLNEQDQVLYIEQVPEITQEPNYDKALAALV
ncbi:MAG: tpx [Chlamydiales bacterium]|jgi:thiol peroxidase|nr:tpx [Chlamydiales bacterium]